MNVVLPELKTVVVADVSFEIVGCFVDFSADDAVVRGF